MNILKTVTTYKPNAEEYNKLCSKISDCKALGKEPILLMNDETANYLKLDLNTDSNYADIKYNFLSFMGSYVAIANWLKTGEVIFTDEI